MKKASLASLIIITLLVINSFAGLRGPGKYYGVIVFDRWNGCYIHSGVYLMYVSEKTKKRLHKYQGRSMVINAIEVSQPMNPGDGRIGKYKILGEAKTKRPYLQLDGLKLTVSPNPANDGSTQFSLEIHNESDKKIEVLSNELALTLLRKKEETVDPIKISVEFNPSDGPSYAMITRCSFKNLTGNNLSEEGSWVIGKDNALPEHFGVEPGQTKVIPVSLRLPAGEYDFLCGYGGGVHEDRSIASNLIAFDVDEEGRTIFVNIPGR